MELAALILEFTKALVWPIVALTIALLFRRELTTALSRLREAKLPGGVSLSFEAELTEAKLVSVKVEEAPLPDRARQSQAPAVPLNRVNARLVQVGLQPSPTGLDLSHYRTLAARDPTLALAGLRIELEIAARNLTKGFKIDFDAKQSVSTLFARLRDLGAITTDQADLAFRILRLCNLAVHGESITEQQAAEVIAITQVLFDAYVAWLGWGFDTPWNEVAVAS
jgi:hypothetical protein